MNVLGKTPIILAFFALGALAAAVGCNREEEDDVATGAESDLTTGGGLQDLVISQIYGGGGNGGAAFQNDFIELFNQSDREVELAGKTLQYVSADKPFTKAKNLLTLPDTTAKLGAGKYFLIQLSAGAANPPLASLPDPDYVASTPLENMALSGSTGKVILVNTAADAVEGCGGAAPSVACDGATIIDLVSFGPTSTQFRGAGPAPLLGNALAAVRHSGGCASSGDNSLDFQALAPAPRNSKMAASPVCSGVDASAPPPPPATDAGPKPDAGPKADAGPKPPKDAGPKKDASASTKDSGSHAGPNSGDDDDTSEGDDDSAGDDDDSTGAPKAPATKTKKPSTIGTNNGAEPPTFPASKPDACAMTPGPLGSFSGTGAIFGVALAASMIRRRSKR